MVSAEGCNWKYPDIKTQILIEKAQIYQNCGKGIYKQFQLYILLIRLQLQKEGVHLNMGSILF